ncbi:VOC family protein [Sinorhizobium fredii]|uniref:VOC family protein n=1 Tax=Rhizobium fredii TaxID=380 RepID=UPI00059569AB|nr:VOC family protein [Sinorhizobium fredii]WOS63760.1 glyoxalase/bleomycin resistance/dioxygenase family protein [Sinorhizobium fredii GR64]
MPVEIKGGINIAMKVPSHQYEAVVAFYRDVVGLPPFDEKQPAKGFILGPNRLWIDEMPHLSQAEVWLELFTEDHERALTQLTANGAVRCDAVEELGEGFRGGWVMNPANIVHLVRTPDAW